MEKNFAQKNFEREHKVAEAFERLKEAADLLRTMGFDVTDRLITLENLSIKYNTFPIVSDGLDAIRASYNDVENELVISFTNGLENPDNQKRLEVCKKFAENGWKTDVAIRKKID